MKIGQLDGNQTISSNQSSDNHSDNELSENSSIVESTADTEYGTDEEIDPEPIPANFFPVPNQNIAPEQPIMLMCPEVTSRTGTLLNSPVPWYDHTEVVIESSVTTLENS